jgi:hypothetical protein
MDMTSLNVQYVVGVSPELLRSPVGGAAIFKQGGAAVSIGNRGPSPGGQVSSGVPCPFSPKIREKEDSELKGVADA